MQRGFASHHPLPPLSPIITKTLEQLELEFVGAPLGSSHASIICSQCHATKSFCTVPEEKDFLELC
jgi:hypothetical protein